MLTHCEQRCRAVPESQSSTGQSSTSSGPYGLNPLLQVPQVERKTSTDPKPLVTMADRSAKAQALVLGTLAEHSMPFTMAPVIIETAKTLAKDKKTLDGLSMDRTTASYKMKYGLKKTILQKTLANISSCPFSLNIDEATSANNKKVLAILVSYYSEADNRVVVEHLASIEMLKVNAESLYNSLVQLFEEHGIPWENLVSILMDSCAVMRGNKSGFEKRIRDNKAPQMLDIDGDICHHIHNATKMFCKPFEKYVEKLFNDLHNDMKWSPDLRQALGDICELIGISFTMPDRFLEHRWLSCYDVAVSTLRMFDALQIFYHGFLPSDMKLTYKSQLVGLYRKHGLSDEDRDKIREIHKMLTAKKLTEDGANRKKRIYEKILYTSPKTLLILHLYKSALPQLKSYVVLFQSKEPLIHKVYDEVETLYIKFLSCYMKQEYLIGLSTRQLMELDLDDDSKYLAQGDIFFGSAASKIIKQRGAKDKTVVEFLEKTSAAYKECGKCLQRKLPLANQNLQAISAIDPAARGHSVSCKWMKRLKDMMPIPLTDDERDSFDLEVQAFHTDKLLALEDDSRIDSWYHTNVFRNRKYNVLGRVIKGVISIFHGPQVESSFSIMGDILDQHTGRMNISTFTSIQTVKYYMLARGEDAITAFKQPDRHLTRNMCSAAAAYKTAKKGEVKKMEKKLATKAAFKRKAVTDEKAAQVQYVSKQRKIARKKTLATLVAKRMDKQKKKEQFQRKEQH